MKERMYDYMSYSKDEMYKYMMEICPYIISDIKTCEGKHISDYTNKLWIVDNHLDSKIAQNGHKHLCDTLFEEIKTQYNAQEASLAIAEFKKNSVLQTGPHMQLAIECNSYYSALFSLIGIEGVQGNYYFLSSCTTPTLEARRCYGPNWLNVYDSNFNVFGLSKSYRRKTSEYCASGEFEFKFVPQFGEIEAARVKQYHSNLVELLGNHVYPTVVDAFHDANRKIWNTFLSDKYKPIFLDEDFYSELLVAHLRDKDSFIYRFFLNWDYQKKVIEVIEKDAELPWGSMIPLQTHFFWLTVNNHVEPLVFEEDSIHGAEEAPAFKIKNDIDSIIDSIEKREMVPGIFTIIMMESFLGCARLIGGLHQFAYYPTFQKAFLSILDRCDREEKLLYDYILKSNLNHWGSHVLEPQIDVLEMINRDSRSYDIQVKQFANYSFDEAIDDLVQFRKYYRWGELLCKR